MKKIVFALILLFAFVSSSFAAVTVQLRRDLAANWTSNNPTLAAGEVGFETDTLKMKIGTGSVAWTDLAYVNPAHGTGVDAMLAIAPGSAGGPTTTIASGTVELNTTTVANSGVIASATCQLLGTHLTATNVLAASDGVDWYFIGNPTTKTGFAAATTGMLTLIPYSDTNGFVQVATCNNTSASITLNTAGNGATIKWAVRR